MYISSILWIKIILNAYHKLIVDTQYHIPRNIFGKFSNIFKISILTHPNAQSEAILTHPNAQSEANPELSVNFRAAEIENLV